MTVNSALGTPGTPTGTTPIDEGQTETVTANTFGVFGTGSGTITYGLLVSTNPYVSWAATGATCTDASNTLTCTYDPSAGTYEYEVTATDTPGTGAQTTTTSSPSAVVTVNTALGAPGTPTGVGPIDQGQAETVSSPTVAGGSGSITYHLLTSPTAGGTFAGTGATCTPSGLTVTCSYAPTAGTYYYEVMATDQASTPVTTTSPISPAMTVYPALVAPGAPTITANPAVDQGQTSTLTATIPSTGTGPISWEWFYSTNGGATYEAVTSSQCTIPAGSGASGGALVTCAFATKGSTAPGSYTFELQVTDSATTAETQMSAASSIVAVSTALTAPTAPSVSGTALDVNQALTVSGTLPSTGTSTYSWQWLISTNGGSFASATQCSVNGGSGANGGATETCGLAPNTLTAGNTYSFELKVTDSATTVEAQASTPSLTVAVSPALTAPAGPSVSATASEVDQVLTVTGIVPSTGTPAYSWQWLISINDGGYAPATQCTLNQGTGASGGEAETCLIAANTLTAGTTYTFELKVADSATTPESQTSTESPTVTVTTPAIIVNPNRGPVGSAVTLTATGFTGSITLSVTFAGSVLTFTSCSVGTLSVGGTTITTTPSGEFVCTFTVPTSSVGSQPIDATGIGVGQAPTYTVTTGSGSSSLWVYFAAAAAAALGLLLALSLLRRRRRAAAGAAAPLAALPGRIPSPHGPRIGRGGCSANDRALAGGPGTSGGRRISGDLVDLRRVAPGCRLCAARGSGGERRGGGRRSDCRGRCRVRGQFDVRGARCGTGKDQRRDPTARGEEGPRGPPGRRVH